MGTKTFDLVIRNGTVVDGTGSVPYQADVAINRGLIAAVGKVDGRGHREIDAHGLLVAPGFVDIHTHYDGQATWGERMQPSSWHGVTTAVMGNCGVGFAPCRPEDHERLIRLMEGVEDIPNPVLAAGLPWNWESFPDYLDALDGRRFDMDVGAQLPHAALRVFVMGERGANREPATPEDVSAMAELARRAIEAGALGFSTSRTINHKTADGEPTPTLTAAAEELVGIARGVGEARAGVLQLITDFTDPEEDIALMRRMAREANRPLSFSLMQQATRPDEWRQILSLVREANRDGLSIRAQVAPRPVGVLMGLETTLNPFTAHPAFREIADLSPAEKAARLRDPTFRQRIATPPSDEKVPRLQNWSRLFILPPRYPDYEPGPGQSIAALAESQGRTAEDVALDQMLSDDGQGLLYLAASNYANANLDHSYEMMQDPNVLPGLSDGGAHVGMICDGSFPTTMMTLWARDRKGPRFTVEQIVRMQAADTAAALGLHDRGRIAVGLRADINVIDFDALTVHAPEIAHDLPAGGRRLIQRADGYCYTIVAGQITYQDGEPTGALPGRLVRGGHARATALAA